MSQELIKISSLPDATTPSGNEYVPVTQGGVTKKMLTSALAGAAGSTVKINGDQTIKDTKTFEESPVVPAPTASGHAVNKGYLDGQKPFQTLTDGATITWDYSEGYNAKVTLGGNRTLAISNAADGDDGLLMVVQDGTGGRSLALPAGSKVLNGGGGAIALSSAAGAVDFVAFVKVGSVLYFSIANNAN